MWRLEKDPFLSSNVANITMLDRPPDVPRSVRRMERATQSVPRLRQRVQPAPVSLSPADVGRRPRLRPRLPHPPHRPARARARCASCSTWPSSPRPTRSSAPGRCGSSMIVDGLEDGRAALIQKFHHTVIDGEAGMRLTAQFVDLERDAPEPPPLRRRTRSRPPSRCPHPVRPRRCATWWSAPCGCRSAPPARSSELVSDPSRIPAAGAAAYESLRAIADRSSPTPSRPARRCGPSGPSGATSRC